jgi:mannose-6-phosphate isomerase-like protein (cupin superfamily)
MLRSARACTALICAACASAPAASEPARAMVVVDERDVTRQEAPPHGAIGMSTAYRISDAAPGRAMEFRKRILHPGAAIGPHVIGHDEVYYVLEGEGEVSSDGAAARLGPGMAAYLYEGASVGIRQLGDAPLTIIIAYPLAARTP